MANPNSPSPYLAIVRSRFSSSVPPGVQQAHHLQSMDSEIHSIALALAEARRIRNTSVGACRLPPEILTQVFEDAQEQWKPDREVEEEEKEEDEEDEEDEDEDNDEVEDEKGHDVFTAGWMVVTHVCAYWRKVALETPSLWSETGIDVFSIHPGYIPDIMERCRGRPITLHVNPESISSHNEYHALKDTRVDAWISPHVLSLTKDLTISAPPSFLDHTAFKLPTEWTHLRKLYLETNSYASYEYVAPAPFGALDTVTDLTLSACSIPWQSPIFSSSLTRLVLLSRGSASYPQTYITLRDLLSRTPRLEVLELENIVPKPPSDQHSDLAVDLPVTMRRVSVEVIRPDFVVNGLLFMRHIRHPPRCSIDFSIWPGPSLVENLAVNSVLQEFLQHMQSKSNVTSPQRLVLSHNTLITASTDVIATDGPHAVSSTTLPADTIINAFAITESGYTRADDKVIIYDMAPLLKCIHLGKLRAVAFSSETIRAISSQNLWTTFLAGSDVHQINLESPYEPVSAHFFDLRRALCHRYFVESTDDSHWKLLFPRLQTLVLHLTDGDVENAKFVISLVELMRTRAELGAPMQEVLVPRELSYGPLWDILRATVKVTPVTCSRTVFGRKRSVWIKATRA
ncbi:unnamed protein product [Peniophora sp. CBMAI 1063]|nr:unnamed protein product [Peniophora sp. CBMAI 1063]